MDGKWSWRRSWKLKERGGQEREERTYFAAVNIRPPSFSVPSPSRLPDLAPYFVLGENDTTAYLRFKKKLEK